VTDEQFHWIQQEFQRLGARVEQTETTLLTEFHKWMEMEEKRHKELRANLHAKDLKFEALEAEMDLIKGRITKLEERAQA